MTKRFDGTVVLITGAAGGLGEAAAVRFAREGANVACVDIKGQENEETAEECRALGVEAMAVCSDVTLPDGADEVVGRVMETWGRTDTLICSAGVYTGALLEDVSLENWNDVLTINLTGTFLYNRGVVPVMKRQRRGSIINISSMAGKTSWEASSQYSASKSGVIGLTRSVAMDLAPFGATANALCPGNTLTDMVRTVAKTIGARDGMTGQEWLDMRADDCPMKRLAEPWEMAGVMAFLASDDSRYLTGQSIEVDGGMILS